jgi:hypothetical protein
MSLPSQLWAAVREDDGVTVLTDWQASYDEAEIALSERFDGQPAPYETQIITLEDLAVRLLPKNYG